MKKDVFGTKYHLIDQYGCDRVEIPSHAWTQYSDIHPSKHRSMQGGARYMRSIGDAEGADAFIVLSKHAG
jgi:hypothetical protein